MGKPELESSLATLDTLIQVFAVLVAVGIVGEVGFGVRHWILNRRLQVAQHNEDLERQGEVARLNKQAGDANEEAGKARNDAAHAIERASKAEENLAGALTGAESAKALAKGYEAQIESARTQAAKAELATAQARLELERLKQPRRLSPEQQQRLIAKLKTYTGQKYSLAVNGEPEAQNLLGVLRSAFTNAGWIKMAADGFGDIVIGDAALGFGTGVVIRFAPTATLQLRNLAADVAKTLYGEGIASISEQDARVMDPSSLNVLVGTKPLI